MKYLVIRHGITDANRHTRAAFGKAGALLNDEGKKQAKELGAKLALLKIGDDTPVAVSALARTRETASFAGFVNIAVNPLLNEVNTPNPQRTLGLIAAHKLPPEALDAAKAIIKNPPKEKLWVTHGLVIAALQELLGRSETESFIPAYCEVREIEIN